MPRIRVLIADDHAILRAGLRALLGAQADVEVVAEAANGVEALEKARQARPDVVLMDLTMPGPRATVSIRRIARECRGARVLVLTMHDDPAYLSSAMMAGASGYVVKNVVDTDLVTAIRAVHRGRTYVDVTRPDGAAVGNPRSRRLGLTRREQEVLRLLARGHTNKEIAERLGVSVKTVETHRSRVGSKLGLRGRAELFRFAEQAGLLVGAGRDPEA